MRERRRNSCLSSGNLRGGKKENTPEEDIWAVLRRKSEIE